ncbi:hypothetical protein N9H45_01155 [Opitutales bacterium]|nr:hypothetical protein [Opitutales bacterium]
MKLSNALLVLGVATSSLVYAQTSRMMMPSVSSPAVSAEGTELGANTTLSSSGIALGNRVKMRGFIDFRYDYTDLDDLATDDDARFRTAADIDFLFDFSPVTGEVHIAASKDSVGLEQAFLRYNFNQDFSLTAGRQLTVLGFEKDESPNMYQTSYAYLTDVSADVTGGSAALMSFIGLDSFNNAFSSYSSAISSGITSIHGSTTPLTPYSATQTALTGGADPTFTNLPSFRRNYVDGIRLNFNNGQFGFVAGLHNGYFTNDDNLNEGNVGIDIAASVMIIPGLELRIGFGYENNDAYDNSVSGYNSWARNYNNVLATDIAALGAGVPVLPYANIFPEADDITHFNFITSYQTGGLTLAFEWDLWNVYVIDMWNMMLLANYQFNDVFGLTFRYSHEDFEADVPGGGEGSSNRFTIGPMFSITNNLTVGIEYSHAELDSDNTGDTSVDELYAETIFSF